MNRVATAAQEATEALLESLQSPEPGPCRDCGSTQSNRVEAPQNEWATRGRWMCKSPKLCSRRARLKVNGAAGSGIPLDPTQVVVQAPYLPPDRFLLDGIDTSEGPTFTVSEAGKVFFNRGAHWMRWSEKEGHMQLDGVEVGTTRTPVGARVYTLTDIEQVAHALASNHAINGAHVVNVLLVVQAMARLYGYAV